MKRERTFGLNICVYTYMQRGKKNAVRCGAKLGAIPIYKMYIYM